MDSSTIVALLVGVAVGTYFHKEVENVVPALKNTNSSEVAETTE